MLAVSMLAAVLTWPSGPCRCAQPQVDHCLTLVGSMPYIHKQRSSLRFPIFISIKLKNISDFLPIWGSHVKSDNTYTIINIHHLAHILDTCTLIFSSCSLFTISPKLHHVTAFHPSPGDTHQRKKKCLFKLKTFNVTMPLYLS